MTIIVERERVMGVFAGDERKCEETKVGIRVSATLIPLDLHNPNNNNNKKMKFLHEIEDVHLPHPTISGNTDLQDELDHRKEDEDDSEGRYDEEEEDDDSFTDAVPIGDVVRVSDDAGEKRTHFSAFEFECTVFRLEDTILVAPEEGKVKPSITIIKDIFQGESESLQVCGQRFYRPEEAEKKEGGTWETLDARELYCSSYLDEFDAITVMHKCIIHFVPRGKTLPDRKQHPGFIVQKFYDIKAKKLRNLTERDW